jgi:hypothetical protein
MVNLIAENLELLTQFHYTLKSNYQSIFEKYWVHCTLDSLDEYSSKFGDNFNLIVYRESDDPFDFISIPYSILKGKLDPKFFNKKHNCWDLSVYEGKLKLRGDRGKNRSDMAEFVGDLTHLPQLQEISLTNISFETIDAAKAENAIINDSSIPETTKEQLLKSRRGQGKFRADLERIEKNCRITKLDVSDYLTACHIKPWSKSTNQERLDGNNGLLLSPHIHHLFDRGLISISQNGNLLISPKLPKRIREIWHIPEKLNVGEFQPRQRQYLRYHEENLFLKS